MNKVIKKIYQPTDSLKSIIGVAVDELGGFGVFISKGDRVLLKPNFNTADPFPASSDKAFIAAAIELVLDAGAAEVIVGDSSTMYQNTRKNFEKLGIFE